MKYLPSPLNVIGVLLIILAILSYSTNTSGGDGLQNFWVIPMVAVGVIMLVLDFLLQKFIKSYKKIVLTESLLLISFYGLVSLMLKPETYPTLVLPDAFDRSYVALVYGVQDAPVLFKKSKSLEVPSDGILVTSKIMGETHWAIHFEGKLANGEDVNGFSSYGDRMQCSGKTFEYQIWYLEDDMVFLENRDSIGLQIHKNMIQYCEKNL